MNKIKVSYDYRSLSEKPNEILAASISKNIGKSPKLLSWNGIRELALDVSRNGRTFCTATFKNGKRSKDNFEQQQLFALDFDNKDTNNPITFDEVKKRAEHYELPMLFAYETLSSTNRDKFRIVFLNDTSITDRKVAEAMQLALGTIFPEADSSCYKDTSKMYYGGKGVLYCSDDTSTINIESLFRNHAIYLKDKYKANHYKDRLAMFAEETGIALTQKGLLDISVSDNPTESLGASQNDDNGKNSPSAIIYSPNIIADGEIFPNRYYCIRFVVGTGKSSVTTSVDKTDVVNKQYKNHQEYRSIVLEEMDRKCQLFNEFRTGERNMSHDELFGLATNLIEVETGYQKFKEIQSDYPNLYNIERCHKWESILSYIKQQSYKPMQCNNFCPYKKQCNHSTNILSTVYPKRGIMEKLPDYHEEFYSIEEVQEDTYSAIYNAYRSSDNGVQIIKSMTGAGKSHSYLRLMAENPDDRFLIAAPTNLLKNEIYRKAHKMGIDIAKTPSLDEIKEEIPPNVWNRINQLYKSGQHKAVQPYIREVAVKKNIPCLKKYVYERDKLKKFGGSVITTHRYLLNMDEKRLREYDAVIIDEDIIFKSVISNQCEITLSDLDKLFTETTNVQLSKKIKQLLKFAKTQTCIELDSFGSEEDDDDNEDNDADDISIGFDIPSFCAAKKFFVRKTENEPNLKEDTVVFLKPANFKKVKYIIVSATVDETICNKYFVDGNVNFYECKKAEYKGTLSQYPDKSMSRSCVANNPGIIRRLMKHFELSDNRVITFMKENIGKLHFGNTEGSNTLEGKDILVAGTPYHAEFLYKLVAFFMGLDFDEDEKMTAQIVEHNGYRFRFTTFENENLRSIHFWMIESELEQAVGRARLLRNECTVNLFSNFPLSQAEMVKDFDYDEPSKPAKSTN